MQLRQEAARLKKQIERRLRDQPQARKAAGVYYTPAHVVEYIVEKTVGTDIAKLRILDPACGCGYFLQAAYQYIIKGHRLTPAERKSILQNTIYGMDRDPQAVELSRLSLLLCLKQNGPLPDLSRNIRCGDSLSYDGWGDFDAVIGNPPFGALIGPNEQRRLSERYPVFSRIKDSYVAFIEKAFDLLKPGGKFGFVLPSAWLGGPRYRPLREYLLSYKIESVEVLPFDTFPDAYVDTAILIASKARPQAGLPQQAWRDHPDYKFILDPAMAELFQGILKRVPTTARGVFEMKRGVLFDKKLLCKRRKSKSSHRYFEGDVYRYRLNWSAPRWVEPGPEMLECPKDFSWFRGKRILLRRLVNRRQRLMATFVDRKVVTNKNLYTIRPLGDVSPYYLLGILNSRLISRLYLSQVAQATKDDFPQITIRDILALPFPRADTKKHDRLVGLVQKMLKRESKDTDQQIDGLVYELYGLNDAEIRIINEGVRH